jgi:hypothetical protein
MSKQLFVWLTLFAMTSLWSRPSAAQLAPTGAHYAGRPSDTGHSGPNDQGGYPASIPLDLPSSRGGLPVPVQIVSGARGFGAAGVGWDIPLSYVMVDNSLAHRRPAMAPGATVKPRERVTLSLLGRNVEMLPQGDGWIGRSATDLSMHENGETWTVVDKRNHVHVHARPTPGRDRWVVRGQRRLVAAAIDPGKSWRCGDPDLPDRDRLSSRLAQRSDHRRSLSH